MDVARMVIPAAAALAMVSAFFGVVIARVTWAEDATHADKMTRSYKAIHEKDQETIATMQRTIDLLRSR